MSRVPSWLKRSLLPIYNGGYRVARSAGEFSGAVLKGRFARCELCGRFGPILFRPRVIPPRLIERWNLTPPLAESLAHKESDECSWCHAKLRARRLGRVILDLYPSGPSSSPANSLAEWVRSSSARSLRVAEINRIDGVHDQLVRLPRFASSDFDPMTPPGASRNGVRCEDLQRLTFDDASFDLLLTSETLEHVPNLSKALAEIRRVLAPGGRHVFTVPVLPGVSKTFARSVLRPDGTLEQLASPIFHPGGDEGYPVFTEFGADLPSILRQHGFEADVVFGPVTESDVAQVYVCRKPEERS